MKIAMILAAGNGTRIGAPLPKQFIQVLNKPLLAYTFEAFETHPMVDAILTVCHPDYLETIKEIVSTYGISKAVHFTPGGATYQESVLHGLEYLRPICANDDIVLIHFGASPLVSEAIITDSIMKAEAYGNGICSDPVVLCLARKDESDDDRSSVSGDDRDRFMGMNSPQTFRFDFLRDMYDEAKASGLLETCEPHTTSLMAAMGKRLYFSRGESTNFKVTSKEDLEIFEALLLLRQSKGDVHGNV